MGVEFIRWWLQREREVATISEVLGMCDAGLWWMRENPRRAFLSC